MAQFGIDTAQNVQVRYEVAGLGDRVVAWMLDLLVLIGWTILVFLVFDAVNAGSTALIVVFLGLPWSFYHLSCEVLMNGQSFGKRYKKIRVVRVDGQEASLSSYLLRWVLRPIDTFYFIGFIVVLVNGKGQRLGDLAAGTTVIGTRQRVSLNETLLVDVPSGHVVRYSRAAELNDRQVRFIKDILTRTRGQERDRIIGELAMKVRASIGGDAAQTDVDLLHTVLLDYVHLTGR